MFLIIIAGVIAQILQASGDREGAQATLAEAESLMRSTPDPQSRLLVAARRVRHHLATGAPAVEQPLFGDLARARELGLSADDEPQLQYEMEYMALAQALVNDPNRRADGLRLLDRLLQAEEASGGTTWVINILARQALGLAQQGHPAPALRALARALALAEPGGYVRTFVDQGPPMAALLRIAGRQGTAPEYVEKLLSHFGPHPGITQPGSTIGNDVESLTPRELEVLRLIIVGASNREIGRGPRPRTPPVVTP
jgi:LuxR family maltose regulon positive regulatory protein